MINLMVNNVIKFMLIMFYGIEKVIGKIFIGDNDVIKGVNGYGIVIFGFIIDYEVEMFGIVVGVGIIFYDVKEVKVGNVLLIL